MRYRASKHIGRLEWLRRTRALQFQINANAFGIQHRMRPMRQQLPRRQSRRHDDFLVRAFAQRPSWTSITALSPA
jgi:hypothetical protein